jgi:NAD-dependent oxidoreductase involved in siderophore biosynthesis
MARVCHVQSDGFRQYAEEALRSVTESKSETQKQALIDLAQTWTRAALKAGASASDNKHQNILRDPWCVPDESTAICLSTR